ncbi:enhancer of mRNA decapping [Rhizina undulata]
MAAQFIGLTVFLTLNDPAQTKLRGLVANVVGQELMLSNVLFVSTGFVAPNYVVSGQNIMDVDIVDADYLPPSGIVPAPAVQYQPPPPVIAASSYQPPASIPQAPGQSHSRPTTAVPVSQPVAPAPFVDPAILSFTRKPSTSTAQRVPTPTLHKPKQPSFSAPITRGPQIAPTAVNPLPSQRPQNIVAMSRVGSRANSATVNANVIPTGPKGHHAANMIDSARAGGGVSCSTPPPRSAVSAATLQGAFSELAIKGDAADAAESSAPEETDDALDGIAMPTTPYTRSKFTGKRSRRGKAHLKKQHEQGQLLEPTAQEENIPKSVVVSPGMFGGAIAQAANAQFNSRKSVGLNGKRQKQRKYRENGHFTGAEEEGWATEDVNEYKETEFDFQGNLDRFDKKTVFSQLRAEDTTADEARLVSFNRRVPAPARKNYQHNENVITTYTAGQSLMDREDWHTSEFIAEESSDEDLEDSIMRGRGDALALDSGRSSRRAVSRQSTSHRRPSTRTLSTSKAATRSKDNLSSSGGGGAPADGAGSKSGKPTLRLSPSNRPCPIVSPLQMLDVERIAEVELGLTDDMMTENAGRGIAQVAIQAFGKRIHASNHNALPVVLVFAGNNKSGARAIAAGRHLKNHHVRVMVCVLGLEREDELLENVRRQLNIFRNIGGRLARWEELASNLKTLDSPPELIVDGLLGMHLSFEDLRVDDQATAFELVQFANKSKASVLAVDIPSGIDGSTGEVAQLEGTGPFHMRTKWVVSMGAPKAGLLNALVSGTGAGWKLFVADIGISNTAWRKYGTRRRHGVEFAAEWVVALEFFPGA